MNKIVLLLYLLCLSFLTVSSQELTQQLDEVVQDFHKEGPGYSIIITKDGETIYHNAVGLANLELEVPLSTDHIFRIGSITKQVTACAILQLIEEGKLDLQDDITKFYPGYPSHGKSITVEHLLTHTSGIKSYTGMEKWDSEVRKQDFTVAGLIDFFKDEPMDFDPGTAFSYNNSGYILLGYIIEKASGMSYEDYVEKEMFAPLGMHDSYYGHPEEILPRRTSGYSQGPDGYINAPFLSMTQPYAAGSLLMTVGDLAIWNKAVFADEVISKESRDKAHTDYILSTGESADYGYGWTFAKLEGSPVITHGGGINGFSTDAAYLPEEGLFIAVFSNCNCLNPGRLMQRLARTAIGKPYIKPKRVDVSEEELNSYVGEYEIAPGFIVTVSTKEGKLLAQPTGQAQVELVPIGERRFAIEVVEAEIQFNQSDTGEVNSLTLFQGGEHQAKKIN